MQNNRISSKEKNQSKQLVDNQNETNSPSKNETNKDNKSSPKSEEKPYWEPLIPRSGRKDRLEIW